MGKIRLKRRNFKIGRADLYFVVLSSKFLNEKNVFVADQLAAFSVFDLVSFRLRLLLFPDHSDDGNGQDESNDKANKAGNNGRVSNDGFVGAVQNLGQLTCFALQLML